MLLTKRLKAGILLYALFMAAVFALFLQFYVGRLKASHQVRQALYHQTQASLMAEMTKTQAKENRGSYAFEQGTSTYQRKSDQLLVTVQLHTGQSYRYDYLVKVKEEAKDQKEVKNTPNSVLQKDVAKPEEVGDSAVEETSSTALEKESPRLDKNQSDSTETNQQPSDHSQP